MLNVRSPRAEITLTFALLYTLASPHAPAQTGDVRGVHDPAIAHEGDTYWLFSTGVRRGQTLFVRHSQDLHSWTLDGQVFADLPPWAKELEPRDGNLWAPDISFFGGRWHLYYSVSSFGKNRSAIGVATNAVLDPSSPRHEWVDGGKVIESSPGADDWNAIDPHIIVDEGVPWLSFGSYWSGIKLRRIDPATGNPSSEDTTLHSLASRPGSTAIEAPVIVRSHGGYWLFVSFDRCCAGTRSTYNVAVGRADVVTGPYEDREGRAMLEGGGTQVLKGYGRYRGPGHCAVLQESGRDWLVHHYYDADDRGRPKLQVRPLLWPPDGWPIAGEPIPGPPPAASFRPSAVGSWEHRVDFADTVGAIRLLSNGRTNDPGSADTWALRGSSLTLEWPRDEAPGGVWIESCAVSIDGSSYAGRNQSGTPVLGRRVSGSFIRGDANSDAAVDISDAVFTLRHLFDVTSPIHCTKALDSNDDGSLDVCDAVFLVDSIFRPGARIPPPSPPGGSDPTPDGLGC